jgi:Na+-transporting methylmalonyl-CoA/oxaloacetate decarboxylase gamma subunit
VGQRPDLIRRIIFVVALVFVILFLLALVVQEVGDFPDEDDVGTVQ